MPALTPDECRVLGTLIEKALTTPGQYPLSLNSLVTGVNQKHNRDPVVEIDEDEALRAIDGLRAKGLARDVTFTGSRVEKYRHTAGEGLELRAPELALVSELLLRGPQTVGELRGRASRMHPFESLEVVEEVLKTLSHRAEPNQPLVRELPPAPGSRATRWMQLLCEDLHPLGPAGPAASAGHAPSARSEERGAPQDRLAALEARVAALEAAISELRETR
ncbi:MAG: hypothetical protein RL325_280 [Planctomycetota bacterium]|jgi:uncharacterized protein YceH (UPF0502 family)